MVLKKLLPFLFLLMTFTANSQSKQTPGSSSQNETIKESEQRKKIIGIIKDKEGEPMTGVNVIVKNTKTGVITDSKGQFAINVNKQDVLLISYLGFESKEVPVKGEKQLNITLQENSKLLDQVVVIGYGTSKVKDLTGSVGRADIESLKKAPVSSFDQALGGRIAGVVSSSNDGQPGAASQISIRGSSISQDASPLYVVDGFPIENMDMNSINPNDIESIDVLKDASSIAIYGARGANGVIMITTKRAVVSTPKVTYSYSDGYQFSTKKVETMSPYEFVELQLELDSLKGLTQTRFHDMYLDPENGVTLDSYKTMKGDDWQDLLLRTGRVQNHYLSVSGGNEDTKYMLTGSYFDQQGIIINTGLKRYTGTLKIDQRFSKDLRGGVNVKYSNSTKYGTIPSAGDGGGVVQSMWQYRPVPGLGKSITNSVIDSTAMEDFLNGTGSIGDNQVNPKIQAENEYRKNIQSSNNLNGFLEYSFLKNFKLRLSGAIGNNVQANDAYYNSKTQQGLLYYNAAGVPANTKGINGSTQNTISNNYLVENLLTYNNKFNKNHVLNAILGFTYQYNNWYSRGFFVTNAPQSTEDYGIQNLSSGIGSVNSSSFMSSLSQIYSLLSRVNYTISNKYLFTFSVRSDGSSKFTPGKQWGYFPSGAFAWRFTEEPFMKKASNFFEDGKLRISYGSVGNNRVGDFSYMPWAGSAGASNGYAFNNTYVPGGGLVPYFYGNNNLTWETTTELDLGINFTLLKGRISIDADYYDKRTKDFLLSVTLPAMAGYTNGANKQYQNTGAIQNRGFEFAINTVNINNRDFKWMSNFNISFNNNKILSFYEGRESLTTSWGLNGGATAWIAKTGGPISQFFGYKFEGLYQYPDFNKLANGTYSLKNGIPTYASNVQPGDPKYVDINGDGVVDVNDQTTLGSPMPICTGGFSNTFIYKRFSLDVFLQYNYGSKILNANRLAFESTGSYFTFGNQFATYANRWTPTNQNTDIPAARVINPKGDAGTSQTRPSSRVIEDGSFIRLKTVSLSYRIPEKISKMLTISDLSIFVNAQNLFTLTKYSGLDPEVDSYRSYNSANSPTEPNTGNTTSGVGFVYIQPSSGTPVLSKGYDYTPYPRALTITYGFKISF